MSVDELIFKTRMLIEYMHGVATDLDFIGPCINKLVPFLGVENQMSKKKRKAVYKNLMNAKTFKVSLRPKVQSLSTDGICRSKAIST